MEKYPLLEIDLNKIGHNVRVLSKFCEQRGIEVVGVTKVTCGSPQVARIMLQNGLSKLADSRLENLEKMRKFGIQCEIMLLRTPMLSQVDDVIKIADISLNSELSVIKALSNAAIRQYKKHKIILMVDVGDLREGVLPIDVLPMINTILRLRGIELLGIGTNLACFAGIIPTKENMNTLIDLKKSIENKLDYKLNIISGANSSSILMILSGDSPREINQIRIGEGILLGRETIRRTIIPETYQDAFIFKAEIIEIKEKPSKPVGIATQNAFGECIKFEDRGYQLRAITAAGKQDLQINGIVPLDKKIDIIGGSSDHIILNISKSDKSYKVGDILSFNVNYGALLAAMTSEYVYKHYI